MAAAQGGQPAAELTQADEGVAQKTVSLGEVRVQLGGAMVGARRPPVVPLPGQHVAQVVVEPGPPGLQLGGPAVGGRRSSEVSCFLEDVPQVVVCVRVRGTGRQLCYGCLVHSA